MLCFVFQALSIVFILIYLAVCVGLLYLIADNYAQRGKMKLKKKDRCLPNETKLSDEEVKNYIRKHFVFDRSLPIEVNVNRVIFHMGMLRAQGVMANQMIRVIVDLVEEKKPNLNSREKIAAEEFIKTITDLGTDIQNRYN